MWIKTKQKRFGEEVRMLHRGSVLDRQVFCQIVRVEKERADRSGMPVTVAVFTVRDEKSSNTGSLAAALCRTLQSTCRMTDHVGIIGDNQVGVVLWGTRDVGAYRFVSRLGDQANHLATDCKLFVYPERSGHDEHNRTTFDNDESDSSRSQDGGDGNRILDRITEVEEQLAQALDVETPVVQEEDINHVDQSLDFGADVEMAPDFASSRASRGAEEMRVSLESLENLFLIPLPRWKRWLDVVGAAFGMVVLSPVFAAVAVAVKWTSPGPILFRQLREGHGGRLFTIYKFRTMRVGADAEKAELQAGNEQHGPAFKMENDPRITPIGTFLRKTCLDELPQLWNVLRGDMTLVGPRPLDVRESTQIARWGRRRLYAMPGLTCLWQVYGKSRVTFNEWMRMDIRYSQKESFWQDLRLIVATVRQMLLRNASH